MGTLTGVLASFVVKYKQTQQQNMQPYSLFYRETKNLFTMMDGWMTYNFISFSKVFQPHQEDERVIMKGC